MLTLNEIRNVNFRKANFGGYRAEDVEAFIDEVQLSYDTLLRENAELVKKLEVLAAKLEEYQGEEDSIRNALMNAQKVGDASLRDAKHKAEIILKDATIKAEKIVANAQNEIHSERDIIERMQRDIAEFKAKLLRVYKEHLTLINNIPNDEIMRPETKDMVDSVQMLDRRATDPIYDAPQGDSRPARMQPTREFSELPPEYPSDRKSAPQPGFGRENTPIPAYAGGDAVVREDVRKQQRGDMDQPSVQPPVMPAAERSDKRKGGFTVDIGDDFGGSDTKTPSAPRRQGYAAQSQQGGYPAKQNGGGYPPAQNGGGFPPVQNGGGFPPAQNNGNGGFDDMQPPPAFTTVNGQPGQQQGGQAQPEQAAVTPASLFNRRKRQQ